MTTPSGGLGAAGSSGGSGVSVFLFHRNRHAWAGRNRYAGARAISGVICRNGVMSSSIQNPRPCVPAIEIGILDDQISNRSRRHVQPQRLPRIAVVERDVHGQLAPCEQQAAPLRILANDIDHAARRQAARDLHPALAAIARAIDVRTQIVQPQRIDGCVRRSRIEVRCLEHGHFGPRHERRRSDVRPVRRRRCA